MELAIPFVALLGLYTINRRKEKFKSMGLADNPHKPLCNIHI